MKSTTFFILLLLIHTKIVIGQVVLYQDTYKGGVTAGGFSTGLGSGDGSIQLYVENNSLVKKAYLFSYTTINANDSLKVNGEWFQFYTLNRISSFDFSNHYFSPVHLNAIDITSWLQNNQTEVFDFEIPFQSGLPYEGVFAPFIYIAYENILLPEINTTIVINTQNIIGNELYTINNLNSIDNSSSVGFSIYSDRVGGKNGPSVNEVYFNNNLLGIIGGSDNNLWIAGGVKGHFYYQNNQLFGLDNDTPDPFMDGTDALADVSSYLSNNSTSCNFRVKHTEFPNQHFASTGIKLAYFLTYSTPCAPFDVSAPNDTTVCHGSQLQLSASGGQSYEWQPATGLSCTNCPNPVFSADSSMFYTVRIWNNDSCSVVRPIKINVHPELIFSTVNNAPAECEADNGAIVLVGLAPQESFAVSENGDTTSNTGVALTNLGAGNYTVYYINTVTGCKSEDTLVTIGTVNNTVAGFTVTPQSGGAPLSVLVDNTSQHATNFEWSVNGDVQTNPFTGFTADTSGTYEIMLVAWQHSPSCADTTYATVLVYDSLIVHIPNVFTPNLDGVNDFFSISVNQPVKMELVIVNRWGNEVFSFKGNLNQGTTDLWDGGDITDGVYFYKIKMELNIPPSEGDTGGGLSSQLKKEGFVTVAR